MERGEAVAVDADDLGRDALADLGLVARLGEDHQAAVAVQVDEAGSDDLAGGIDAAPDVRRARRRPDPRIRSRSPSTTTLPGTPGRAGPVDDRPAAIDHADPRCPAPSSASRSWALQAPAADPGATDHVGMGPEDQAAHEVLGLVVGDARDRRRVGRVDRDEVGLLAGLERADPVAEPQRRRPAERADPQPVERGQVRARSRPRAVARAFFAYAPTRIAVKIERSGPAATSEPETDRQARPRGSARAA